MFTIKFINMKYIKENLKLIIGILILIFLFLIIKKTFNLVNRNKNLSNQLHYLQDSTSKQLKYWKDENGKLHATVETLQVDNEGVVAYAKDLEKKLKIKPKQLKGATTVKIVTDIHEKLVYDTVFIEKNPSINEAYSYKDNYLSATYFRKGNEKFIKARMQDTIVQATYWKRKGFLKLGKKQHYTDFHNTNPYNHITPILAVETANPKKPIVSLAPAAGIMWGTDGKARISAGVVIVPDFLTIKIR